MYKNSIFGNTDETGKNGYRKEMLVSINKYNIVSGKWVLDLNILHHLYLKYSCYL